MYFLSDIEQKQLLYQLLPLSREVKVSNELRGWNWHHSPLKPYFDVRLPMYQVCSKYCPTNRDIYLRSVEKQLGLPSDRMVIGKLFHNVVSDCLQSVRLRQDLSFDVWWQKVSEQNIGDSPEVVIDGCRRVWDFTRKMCDAKLAEFSCSQPYVSEVDLLGTAVPFLVEHKLSGRLLGLSDILSVDCFDYFRTIMFDLKVNSVMEDWHRFYSVGYALVFESIYEVPVDICCTVYLTVDRGRVSVQKDLFFANDELRQWWIEERDKKLEIVAERKDPGKPECSQCKEYCQYYKVCHS
ncbi:MAG: type I-A CRISPR-associated protein Cas4/Csa1 [Nitrososphaerota archaeon]|jgi:CRISPR-associated protein Csa1|nr:type I-A CRISPR-associated protein Cas4/Csa1 [Nitrososphaerota archaeon]